MLSHSHPPGKGVTSHISRTPSWTDPPTKGGELPGFLRCRAAPAQPPVGLQCRILTSPIPANPSIFPSDPCSHPTNTSPFPATDTQLWPCIYTKSRVYCHFYQDLHNCVTASDVKRDVPSVPRELAGQVGSLGAQAGPPSPDVSPDPPNAAAQPLSRWIPERGESVPSFGLLTALATQLQPLTVPVLP